MEYLKAPVEEFATGILRGTITRFASSKSRPATVTHVRRGLRPRVPSFQKKDKHTRRSAPYRKMRGRSSLRPFASQQKRRENGGHCSSALPSSHSPFPPLLGNDGHRLAHRHSFVDHNASAAGFAPGPRPKVTTILSAVQCRPPVSGTVRTHHLYSPWVPPQSRGLKILVRGPRPVTRRNKDHSTAEDEGFPPSFFPLLRS